MGDKTIINFKTDKKLKSAAQKTAKELGIPLTTIMNAFLRQFVRDKEVTFSIPLRPSQKLRTAIAESDRETGSDAFDSADAAMLSLDLS